MAAANQCVRFSKCINFNWLQWRNWLRSDDAGRMVSLVTIQQLRMSDTCVQADGASRTNHLGSAHAGAILQGMCT
jgi:hypothetical protein